MDIRVTGVAQGHLLDAWPKVLGFLEEATKASLGCYTIHSVWEGLMKKELQLWVVCDFDELIGVVVTRLVNTEECRVLEVSLMAGHDYKEWIDQIHFLESYAASEGAEKIRTLARAGSARLLVRKAGFKEVRRLCEKVVWPRKMYH